jgi:thiamine-monophosphate kinase
MKISENIIIKNYLRSLTFMNKNSLDLKDDVYYDSKRKLIFSTDTFEEDVHFINSSEPKNFVKKLFRSSISDIVCKGGQPEVYFLSLSLKKTNKNWLNSFTNELKKESIKYGLFLGGGDTIKSKKITITISVIGSIKQKPVFRNSAKINDDIYVTGDLGDSYLGLLILKKKINFGKFNNYFRNSYQEPKLPLKFAHFLYKFASSSMDISDGLIKDLENICISSKCGAQINFSNLPFSNLAKKMLKLNKINTSDIFSRGDDYQILFTANQKFRELIHLTSKKTSTKTTRIGRVLKGKSIIILKDDKILDFSGAKTGYIHKF